MQWIWGTDEQLSTGTDRHSSSDGRASVVSSDTITGGVGDDLITPGSGSNILQFATALASGTAGTVLGVDASTGTDTITAFVVANDQFQLDLTVFGSTAGSDGGTLAAAQFDDVAGTAAAITAADVGTGDIGIVFDTTNSDLYFIEASATFTSGTTTLATLVAASEAFVIADITSITGTLAASDFNIVS